MQLWNNYKERENNRAHLWRVTGPDGTVETVRSLRKWAKDRNDVRLPRLYEGKRDGGFIAEKIDDTPEHGWEIEHPDGYIEISYNLVATAKKYNLTIDNIRKRGHDKKYKARRLYNVGKESLEQREGSLGKR